MVFCPNEMCSGIYIFNLQSFNPSNAVFLVRVSRCNGAVAEFTLSTNITKSDVWLCSTHKALQSPLLSLVGEKIIHISHDCRDEKGRVIDRDIEGVR